MFSSFILEEQQYYDFTRFAVSTGIMRRALMIGAFTGGFCGGVHL